MKLRDILKEKGSEVFTVEKTDSIRKAIEVMVEKNIGAVVVTDSGKPVGIFSERDLLRRCCSKGISIDETPIEKVMTSKIIYASSNDTLQKAAEVMTLNRIRHLPIIENGALKGLVSIGDLMKAECKIMEKENEYLKGYISDEYPS